MLAALACVGFAPAARAQVTMSYEENLGTHTVGEVFSGPFPD